MIQPITMYEAICDNCGENWSSADGFMAYHEKFQVKEQISDDEWISGDNVHMDENLIYCPKCYRMNDNDELELIPQTNP